MKTLINYLQRGSIHWASGFFLLLFIFAGCSLDGINTQDEDITEEDLQAASQIIGESLSDETSGVMGSLNDAIASISSDGFERTGSLPSFSKSNDEISDDDDNTGRGNESNFSYSYDPETGTHTLSFNRAVTSPRFSKIVTDTLKYIFTDNQGNFIALPRTNRERVETIDFRGFREGNVETPNRNSFFTRVDTFIIDGVSDASAILNIDGVHNGEGNFEASRDNGDQLQRTYSLEINFLNIEVDKAVVQTNQSVEQGVIGSLTYEIEIEKTVNGSSSTKTIRGNIELNGDGTALLRFRNFQRLFQINLDDGDVRDQDDEFEGRVRSVNLDRNTFILANGRVISITEDTEIEKDGDLLSLEQVAQTLENTPNVRAEGEGFIEGDVFIATEVEFEIDDDSDDDEGENDPEEFEGLISSVNLEAGTFSLQNGTIILVNEGTEIDKSGDFQSLQEIAEALEQNESVEAEGEGITNENDNADLTATEVRFEIDNDDD